MPSPENNTASPLAALEEAPEYTFTPPDAPNAEVPVYNTAAPLLPTDSASDDRIATRPDDDDTPPPDTTLTLPPDALVDVVLPAPT